MAASSPSSGDVRQFGVHEKRLRLEALKREIDGNPWLVYYAGSDSPLRSIVGPGLEDDMRRALTDPARDDDLLGILLTESYPDDLPVADVVGYLRATKRGLWRRYGRFWTDGLIEKTKGRGRTMRYQMPLPCLLLTTLALLITATCGDDPVEAPNRAPVASATIPDATVAVGDSVTLDLTPYFSDPDGDTLVFKAVSSDASVATVSASRSTVTTRGVAKGAASVTVTATDPEGLSASQDFKVTVPNRQPRVADTIPGQQLFRGDSAMVGVAPYFSDPDDDPLTFEATSSDASVATVSVSGDTVTVLAVASGSTTATVTAADPEGLSVSQDFEIMVPNRSPTVTDSIADRELFRGDSVRLGLTAHFTDPDDDPLTFEATSSDSAVTVPSVAGAMVTIRAVAQGAATATVTASDPGGLTVSQTFQVTIPNRPPRVSDSIAARELFRGDSTTLDMAAHFDDPDGDSLAFTSTSSDSSVVLVSVSGGSAKVSAAGLGTAAVTVIATDPGGLSVSQAFEVTVRPGDRDFLEALYRSMNGDAWVNRSNWLTDKPLHEWHGVRTDPRWGSGHRVISLVLRGNNLNGPIPPEIGGLDSLEHLDLAHNPLNSPIPPELGGLDDLFSLVLRYNELSGPIPAELSKFRGLRDMFLNQNAGITGRLPLELGYTGGLEYFMVNDTDLSGPVPPTFANLELTRFYFDRDGVCIPAALREWVDSIPQKEDLYQLCTDNIVIDPPSLYLEVHSLGDTARLTAAVISAEGDTVPDAEIAWASADTAIAAVDSTGLVTTVDYGTTEITATSDSLADTARVEIVYKLSNRQVLDSLYRATGGENWTDTTNWLSDEPLSEWYGVETSDSGEVVGLSLGDNNLTGSVPDVLAELDSLVTLDLGGNVLGGRIPGELRELQQLRDLLLNDNELEGLLPRSLGEMAGLRYLDIGDNKLSGVVPREFSRLDLDTLYAAGSGVCVPPSLGDWFEEIERTDSAARCVATMTITVVDLPSLSFYAPGETGDLTATYVSAEGDTTRGVTATWSSGDTAVASVSAAGRVTAVGSGETEITAAYDSITGTIAAVVALPENDRDVLEILYDRARGDGWTDATNWLTDEPLSEWAGVETDDSGRVVKLSLRDNNVRGPLHSSIGLLDRLVTLDLSRNWISGPILAEVGDLALLRDLTLSVNGFVGGLPSALGALDSLRNVNVAATSMSGMVPASFEDLELESFLVNGTGVCVPPSLSEWLDSIAETDDPPACASRVVVEPASLTFEASGDTARLSATVIDAEGDVVEDAEVTWKSGDTRVARVNTTGLVTARASGVTKVTATYDSVTSGSAEAAVRLPGGDRVALEAFYRAMGGDDWTDNTNWMSDEPLGEWYGVDTHENGRVQYLELRDNNVTGRIPAEIGLLDSLFSFKLRDTTVTGPIPPAIGRLGALRDLGLGRTRIDGPLPPEMGNMAGLDYAYLSSTRLSGPLPATLANLDVGRIYLGNTDLCLPRSLTAWYESRDDADDLLPCIPETSDREVLDSLYSKTGGENWGRKHNWRTDKSLNTWRGITTDPEGYVTEIFLPWNNLTDSIPPELGNLSRLEVLSLYGNELTGQIPPELGKLTTVTELSLSSNELEGPIPPEIGGMVGVDTMWLSNNRLSGPIPAEFGDLVNLEQLALFENELSGPLPAEFGKLKKLKTAWLVDNKFEGPLPPELGNMTALEDISLSRNRITGSLPPELGKLQNLKELGLGDNELTGSIPPELGDMASLEGIFLQENQLSGSIPPELGKLSKLEWMWLWDNDLTGPIPAVLGNLSKLVDMAIGTNDLSGSIPPELGQLSALESLHLGRTKLTGPIPAEPC